MLNFEPTEIVSRVSVYKKKLLVVLVILLVLVFLFQVPSYLNKAPADFPLSTEIVIHEGQSHTEIAKLLVDLNVIKSSLYLTTLLRKHYPDKFIKAGVYLFDDVKTSIEVAELLITGDAMTSNIKVTFPEGFSTANFIMYLPETASYSTSKDISELEGYLFPDTYFITEEMTLDEILQIMMQNFEKKTDEIKLSIDSHPLTFDEIIILASIIEREAGGLESKKIVSGILQNRLEIGMALQVDAVFDYLLNKESAELTIEDLAYDSPYNTYLYAGLPPGPISNPGLDSIKSVLEPTQTDYLYYLTAPDGTFYYSKTFDGHKDNKWRYLR